MTRQPSSESESESVAREVAARILAMRKEGETDADFARRLGITPQLLNHYKKGGGASVEAVARITKNDPRAYWLLTGEEHTPRDEWEELALETVRFANGEHDDEEAALIRRDLLTGLIKLGEREGRDVRLLRDALRQIEAGLSAPPPPREPAGPRAVDVLAFYDRESRAAELRAEGMREWAVAVRIAEEETRARRQQVSSAQDLTIARQGHAAIAEVERQERERRGELAPPTASPGGPRPDETPPPAP